MPRQHEIGGMEQQEVTGRTGEGEVSHDCCSLIVVVFA